MCARALVYVCMCARASCTAWDDGACAERRSSGNSQHNRTHAQFTPRSVPTVYSEPVDACLPYACLSTVANFFLRVVRVLRTNGSECGWLLQTHYPVVCHSLFYPFCCRTLSSFLSHTVSIPRGQGSDGPSESCCTTSTACRTGACNRTPVALRRLASGAQLPCAGLSAPRAAIAGYHVVAWNACSLQCNCCTNVTCAAACVVSSRSAGLLCA